MVSVNISNENKIALSTAKKPLFAKRWILVLIIFLTFMTIFFIRNCISVAIVAMVYSNSSSTSMEIDTTDETDVCQAATYINDTSDIKEADGEFIWTPSEQGLILGAYFWGLIVSRLLLSRVCELFGHWKSISLGLIIDGILLFLSPLCAKISPYLLAANRFIIGAMYGPNAASVQCLIAAWAPKEELGIMLTVGYSGYSVGGLLSLFISGWLSEHLGWRSIFYVGGFFAFLTAPLWIFFVKDHPRDDLKLSDYERNLLKENNEIKTQRYVPWIKIITSPQVLICMLTYFSWYWIDVTTSVDAPSFLHYKIGLDLDTASYVGGGLTLIGFFSSIFYGFLSDIIINRNYLSKVNTRKLFHFIGTGIPSFVLIGVIIANCNKTAVVTLWLLIGVFYTATALSFALSTIDIAPNYTAVINALMAIGIISGAIAPSVTSALLKQENGWNKFFFLTVTFNLLSCVLYILFIKADPQPWNFYEGKKSITTNNNEVQKIEKMKHIEIDISNNILYN